VAYIPSDERRQLIVNAAIDVIASEGLAAVTTRRVAEKAGAPLGAMHYCFKNKEELLHLVAEEGARRLRASVTEVDPTLGLEATIRNDIDALWNWYQQNIGLQLALTEMGFARIRRGGSPNEIYAMWGPYGGDLLKEHLQEAQRHDTQKLKLPIPEIVRFILHRFDGLTIEYAASRDRKACQRQVDILAEAMVLLAVPKPGAKTRRKPEPTRGRAMAE
jgi:AcrR family transcriptional regulator